MFVLDGYDRKSGFGFLFVRIVGAIDAVMRLVVVQEPKDQWLKLKGEAGVTHEKIVKVGY
jgi:hypothetical protein